MINTFPIYQPFLEAYLKVVSNKVKPQSEPIEKGIRTLDIELKKAKFLSTFHNYAFSNDPNQLEKTKEKIKSKLEEKKISSTESSVLMKSIEKICQKTLLKHMDKINKYTERAERIEKIINQFQNKDINPQETFNIFSKIQKNQNYNFITQILFKSAIACYAPKDELDLNDLQHIFDLLLATDIKSKFKTNNAFEFMLCTCTHGDRLIKYAFRCFLITNPEKARRLLHSSLDSNLIFELALSALSNEHLINFDIINDAFKKLVSRDQNCYFQTNNAFKLVQEFLNKKDKDSQKFIKTAFRCFLSAKPKNVDMFNKNVEKIINKNVEEMLTKVQDPKLVRRLHKIAHLYKLMNQEKDNLNYAFQTFNFFLTKDIKSKYKKNNAFHFILRYYEYDNDGLIKTETRQLIKHAFRKFLVSNPENAKRLLSACDDFDFTLELALFATSNKYLINFDVVNQAFDIMLMEDKMWNYNETNNAFKLAQEFLNKKDENSQELVKKAYREFLNSDPINAQELLSKVNDTKLLEQLSCVGNEHKQKTDQSIITYEFHHK